MDFNGDFFQRNEINNYSVTLPNVENKSNITLISFIFLACDASQPTRIQCKRQKPIRIIKIEYKKQI